MIINDMKFVKIRAILVVLITGLLWFDLVPKNAFAAICCCTITSYNGCYCEVGTSSCPCPDGTCYTTCTLRACWVTWSCYTPGRTEQSGCNVGNYADCVQPSKVYEYVYGTYPNGSSVVCCSPVNGGWSAWSSCQANCTQTRTCDNPSPYCGGSGCSGPSVQTCGGGACTANITGTLFDASDMTSCPGDIGTNPAYSPLRFGGATFNVTSTTPTSQSVTTAANGTYTVAVSPDVLPKTYSFDFSNFLTSGRVTELKLQCQGATATTTTGETVTKDTGFWRQYGGWWQVIGGNVYARLGIGSSIPGSVLPTTDQKLILDDVNGRDGTLSYGLLLANQLGTNPNAMVSTSQREVLSQYEGLRYDYNFYKTRMDIFASTIWDGGDVTYNDGGKGYQIFKYAGNIDLKYGGPAAGEKVIILVDGSVTVNQDITVPSGSFLAIITNGNITFSDSVANAHGWYVAENINIPCHDGNSDGDCDKDDVQFVGQGSFVGWTGIYMTRDRAATNNQEPSEQFTYRSDLLLSAPDPMRVYTRKFSPFVP